MLCSKSIHTKVGPQGGGWVLLTKGGEVARRAFLEAGSMSGLI